MRLVVCTLQCSISVGAVIAMISRAVFKHECCPKSLLSLCIPWLAVVALGLIFLPKQFPFIFQPLNSWWVGCTLSMSNSCMNFFVLLHWSKSTYKACGERKRKLVGFTTLLWYEFHLSHSTWALNGLKAINIWGDSQSLLYLLILFTFWKLIEERFLFFAMTIFAELVQGKMKKIYIY